MIWQAIVIFVSLGIAFLVIRRFTIRIADERAERKQRRNVEAIKATNLSDVAKRLRLTYALDENPSAVKPPVEFIAQPKPKPKRNIELED
jgi:hypothetical protein